MKNNQTATDAAKKLFSIINKKTNQNSIFTFNL